MKRIALVVLSILFSATALFAGMEEAKNFYNEKKYDEALAQVRDFLKQNPNNGQAVSLLMDIYKAQGQSGLYLKVLRNQIENGKNYDYSVLWDGANRSFQIRDYDMVVFFSKQCNEKSPNRHSIYNLMGVAYYYLKQYRLSVIALKTAVAFMPKEPIYNANLGRSYEMLGEYAKAAEYYEVSLKYDPDFRRSALSLKRVKALLSNQKSE